MKPTFQELVDSFISAEDQQFPNGAEKGIQQHEHQEIEIFEARSTMTKADIDKAIANLGKRMVHPYSLVLWAKKHPELGDGLPLSTHWVGEDGVRRAIAISGMNGRWKIGAGSEGIWLRGLRYGITS